MLEVIRPELYEMSFREYLMADEMTMSYNANEVVQYHLPGKSGRIGMMLGLENLTIRDTTDI